MQITLNGTPLELNTTTTLEQLLRIKNCLRPGVAVAINEHVIPRAEWDKTKLEENDKILVITATQGG